METEASALAFLTPDETGMEGLGFRVQGSGLGFQGLSTVTPTNSNSFWERFLHTRDECPRKRNVTTRPSVLLLRVGGEEAQSYRSRE
jgi:hypothetical protein